MLTPQKEIFPEFDKSGFRPVAFAAGLFV